ncbi:MAG: hypothetical protein IT478_02410, partial [Xanthomonadales bacterium]|nr:hypothetical protein [Xanthomonadales bacterium]
AIEAADGQIPEWVKVEAAMRGVTVATDGAGNAVIQLGTNATSAFKQITDGAAAAIGSFSSITDAARKANKELSVLGSNTYDAQGFATDSQGNRINITGQLDIPDGSSFDQQAFMRAQQSAALSGLPAPNPQNFVTSNPGAIVTRPSDIYGPYEGQFNNGAGASPFGPKKAGNSVQMNITIDGKKAGQVNVASQQDASALSAVIRQVGDAARSSGSSSSYGG